MKRNGLPWILTGLLLIAAALFLLASNLLESQRAKSASASTLARLEAQFSPSAASPTSAASAASPSPALPNPTTALPTPAREMPVVTLDDEAYIGILSIPSLELTLPVQQTWDADKLKLAPCRYHGSVYQNDLIIMAHNYTAHFGRLHSLHLGDSVLFTDADGTTFRYTVLDLETLPSDGVADMLSGDWDLTLFTCTVGREQRITVRCVLQDEL